MAHPARAAAAERTRAALAELDTRIAYDPDPAGPPSPWRAFQRIVAVAPRTGTLLVVQEDVVVGRGFAVAAPRVVAAAPDAVVTFYAGRLLRAVPHLRAAADRCQSLADLGFNEYVPTVAVAIPGGLLDELDAWGRRNAPEGYRHDDELLGAFCRGRGVRVLTTVPSLVNHDNTPDSIAGHSSHGHREAWCWLGDHDAAAIEWRLPG